MDLRVWAKGESCTLNPRGTISSHKIKVQKTMFNSWPFVTLKYIASTWVLMLPHNLYMLWESMYMILLSLNLNRHRIVFLTSILFCFYWLYRQLAESGAHVIMAVRNPKAAHELIQKWQEEWSGMGLPLNIEVHYMGNTFLWRKILSSCRILKRLKLGAFICPFYRSVHLLIYIFGDS